MARREMAVLGSLSRPNPWRSACWVLPVLLLMTGQDADVTRAGPWERSFWLHASLGLHTPLNYWGTNFPATPMPSEDQVQKAGRWLAESGAANRLYLIYHRELPLEAARRLFTWWRKATPRGVELVPTLVLRMYDRNQTPVFTTNELAELTVFFRKQINARHLAVYDVHIRPPLRQAMAVLGGQLPDRVDSSGIAAGRTAGRAVRGRRP